MTAKKSILLLVAAALLSTPAFGQKFTKKAMQRREARAANYFYGAQFTLTAGYEHSWLTSEVLNSTGLSFGQSQMLKNTHNAFNIGFLYDQSFSRHWGLQTGIYYNEKGGQRLTYYDNPNGRVLYDQIDLTTRGVELQVLGRYFVPILHDLRVSIGVGPYLQKLFGKPDGFRNWDVGVMGSVGADWRHLSVAVGWQPGIYTNLVRRSDTSMNSLSINIGYRFWKE